MDLSSEGLDRTNEMANDLTDVFNKYLIIHREKAEKEPAMSVLNFLAEASFAVGVSVNSIATSMGAGDEGVAAIEQRFIDGIKFVGKNFSEKIKVEA